MRNSVLSFRCNRDVSLSQIRGEHHLKIEMGRKRGGGKRDGRKRGGGKRDGRKRGGGKEQCALFSLQSRCEFITNKRGTPLKNREMGRKRGGRKEERRREGAVCSLFAAIEM